MTGLLRDRLLVDHFPGLRIVDVYIASFRLSDLLFQIGIMSAMGTILVPMLAAHKAHDRHGEKDAVLSGAVSLGMLLFGTIALVIGLLFPRIAPALVRFSGEDLTLYIRFGRLALLSNLLFVAGNAAGQYLITEQRYWIYGLTPILYTIGTIGGTLFLTPFYGPLGPMLGTLGGALLYVIVRIVGIVRLGFRPRLALWHPDVLEMGVLMLPRMLALGALQVQLLLFDTIASGLDAGSITINAYARNFQSLVVGVAGIALSQSAYSLLSQSASKKEWRRFLTYLEKCLLLLLVFTIPLGVLLYLCAPLAAIVVHLPTLFRPAFYLCLGLYAISIPFESINHLFLRGFYSLKDTTVPAIWGVVTGVLAVAIAWGIVTWQGVAGLPFGYTVTQVLETLVLGVLLWRRLTALLATSSSPA